MSTSKLKVTTNIAPIISTASWSDLRKNTISAFETPSLFETIAENNSLTEDHDEFENTEGTPIGAYSSPLSLWEMKMGLYCERPKKAGLWSKMKWGLITYMCQEENIETRHPEGTYIHPQIPFMSSKLDMEGTTDGGKTWCPIITYNVAGSMAATWRNAAGQWKAPENALITANHHMAVTGAKYCYIIALFGGVTPEIFCVERDEHLVRDITETIINFWSCVTEKRRPRSAGARDLQVLNRLCAQIDPEKGVKDFRKDNELAILHEKKKKISAEQNALKKQGDAISAQIAEKMDQCGAAILDDMTMLYWVTVEEKEEPAKIKPGYSYVRSKKINRKNAGTSLLGLLDNK